MRLFDLNIETVLDHWEVHHGIREVIANALDEQTLSGTAPIQIVKDVNDCWHVRDSGRGIRIEDFTLNENPEKIGTDGIIGKFGVGIKDALATFDRHGVGVSISSPHGRFTLTKASKHDFDAITTLHIAHDPGDSLTEGTDVILTGVPDVAVETAKRMFLCFREHRVLEKTPFGQVIAKPEAGADVFINGVWVNAEPSFLFSYNVISLTDTMRKALNRERVNVGRTVYADRLRLILKVSQTAEVSRALADAYARKDMGDLPEELTWIDVAHKALNELARSEKVVVVSQEEIKTRPELVEDMKRDGQKIVLVTDREKQKADEQARTGAAPFHTLETWISSFNDSFKYTFVDEAALSPAEVAIFARRGEIMQLVGVRSSDAPKVMVSETLRTTTDATKGAWDPQIPAIVIKRSQLASVRLFAGTLLHELAHSKTGTDDCTRAFENALTHYLGAVAETALSDTLKNADSIGNITQKALDRLFEEFLKELSAENASNIAEGARWKKIATDEQTRASQFKNTLIGDLEAVKRKGDLSPASVTQKQRDIVASLFVTAPAPKGLALLDAQEDFAYTEEQLEALAAYAAEQIAASENPLGSARQEASKMLMDSLPAQGQEYVSYIMDRALFKLGLANGTKGTLASKKAMVRQTDKQRTKTLKEFARQYIEDPERSLENLAASIELRLGVPEAEAEGLAADIEAGRQNFTARMNSKTVADAYCRWEAQRTGFGGSLFDDVT